MFGAPSAIHVSIFANAAGLVVFSPDVPSGIAEPHLAASFDSFSQMRLVAVEPGTTRLRVDVQLEVTFTRFPYAMPLSRLIPPLAPVPAWQPVHVLVKIGWMSVANDHVKVEASRVSPPESATAVSGAELSVASSALSTIAVSGTAVSGTAVSGTVVSGTAVSGIVVSGTVESTGVESTVIVSMAESVTAPAPSSSTAQPTAKTESRSPKAPIRDRRIGAMLALAPL